MKTTNACVSALSDDRSWISLQDTNGGTALVLKATVVFLKLLKSGLRVGRVALMITSNGINFTPM
jgi:hypothetical protein